MIIADIITELEKVSVQDLRRAIYGVRTVYRVFPVELKKQMLGDYSNTEYALLQAHRANKGNEVDGDSILEIYIESKQS